MKDKLMAEKILIIDDDHNTLQLIDLMLQRKGYQTVSASNGMQGLLKMDEESPDLILLDVMMPDMDGYEVARRVRNNPETTGIPILMFTAKSQVDDKVTGFEAGADDYITKPTTPKELQTHVRTLLSRSVKAEREQSTPQSTYSEKADLPRIPRRRKNTHPDDILSACFSSWFKDVPPNEEGQ
jgi:pilus assembly protein CpaE